MIQKFVDYLRTRYGPLLIPLPLGEGPGEGAAGAKTPLTLALSPNWGEGK